MNRHLSIRAKGSRSAFATDFESAVSRMLCPETFKLQMQLPNSALDSLIRPLCWCPMTIQVKTFSLLNAEEIILRSKPVAGDMQHCETGSLSPAVPRTGKREIRK